MEYDLDKLADIITKEIIRRLDQKGQKTVYVQGCCPTEIISNEYEITHEFNVDHGCGGCGYVLLTAEAYLALCGGDPAVGCCADESPGCGDSGAAPCCDESCGKTIDLSGKRLLHERDLRDNNAKRGDFVKVAKRTIITALAHDYAKSIGVKIIQS